MLGLNFRLGADDAARAELGIERAATAVHASNREAVECLIKTVGLRSHPADEGYHRQALDYYLGLLYAQTGQYSLTIERIHRSCALPSSGGDLAYELHLSTSLALHRHMLTARERGMPSFLLASMPRAASASLTQTIAGLLDMPVLRISIGSFPNDVLIPHWLNVISPGGAVLHDHFGATPINIATLKQCGIKTVLVLVRDPRAAASSLATLLRSDSTPNHQTLTLDLFKNRVLPWLSHWCAAAWTETVNVQWILSGSVRSDLPKVWRDIGQSLVGLYPMLEPHLQKSPELLRANYQDGGDDRWRQLLDEPAQREMWTAIPSDMADQFGFLP